MESLILYVRDSDLLFWGQAVTQTLERAIAELKKLPDEKQDSHAALILDELGDDQLWDEAFARSQDALSRLADKVREDIRAGRVQPGGMDDL